MISNFAEILREVMDPKKEVKDDKWRQEQKLARRPNITGATGLHLGVLVARQPTRRELGVMSHPCSDFNKTLLKRIPNCNGLRLYCP